MDPVTVTAFAGLLGTLSQAGAKVFDSWLQHRSGGVAIESSGTVLDLPAGGRLIAPNYGTLEPVTFQGGFVPADDWAGEWLSAEQPVLLVIESEDETSDLDSLVAVVPLGGDFEGALLPGQYTLGAFVFLDEDPDTWDYVDGGALVGFSVEAGEPPFSLEIPIEAIPDPMAIPVPGVFETPLLEGSGMISAGEEDHFSAILDADVTYGVYVETEDPGTDIDLYVVDENGNVVAVDEDLDSDATAFITPRWSGPFGFVVRCASGSSRYTITISA